LLRRAWYSLNQAFRQRIQHLAITPDQFSLLRWLSEGDPRGVTQRHLTKQMASDPNTITSTLSRMERAGLVSRHPHETDRRAHRVRLEAAGVRVFEEAREIAVALQTSILDAIPTARREQFLADLEAVGAVAQRELALSPQKSPPQNGSLASESKADIQE
jgi:DNA-binding MarR family transcriptional regulator